MLGIQQRMNALMHLCQMSLKEEEKKTIEKHKDRISALVPRYLFKFKLEICIVSLTHFFHHLLLHLAMRRVQVNLFR
ncbi:hypothetical protein ABTM69_20805, partial [Acinetobacter baumannii]